MTDPVDFSHTNAAMLVIRKVVVQSMTMPAVNARSLDTVNDSEVRYEDEEYIFFAAEMKHERHHTRMDTGERVRQTRRMYF